MHVCGIAEGEGPLRRDLRRFFERQHVKVIAVMDEEGDVPDVVVERVFTRESKDRLAATAMPHIVRAVERRGDEAVRLVFEVGMPAGPEAPAFNLADPNVVRLLERKEMLIRNVDDATKQNIRRTLVEGYNKGETHRQLTERVNKYMSHTEQHRSRTIARHEINSANNGAAHEGYRQMGIPQERWIWSGSADTREDGSGRLPHQEADGQIVNLDDVFTVWDEGLQYPGDPAGRAANVIGCLCTVSPVVV
jgi:hypothetical protein